MTCAFLTLCANKAPRVPRVVATAVAAAAALTIAPSAVAAPPPPSELEVQGGTDAWHPDRDFRLYWRNPTGVAAVRYMVEDASGAIFVAPRRIGWAAHEIDSIHVGGLPGAYVAKVWLEDSAGDQGPAAEAKLRFDDTRPPPVQPLPAATWVGRADFPLAIRLSPKAGPEPPSGLRGFAVSVDRTSGAEPCAAPDRCSEAETDLTGAGAGSFPIPELPEGTTYVHAVAVSGAGIRSAVAGEAVLRVDKTPPTVGLSGAPPSWSNRPLNLVATASDGGSGMRPADGGTPFTAIRIDGGRPVAETGDSVSVGLSEDGAHEIAYYARDLAGNVDDGGDSNGRPNGPPRTALARIDRTPPQVSFAAAQDPREPELIRARVVDGLSGADASRGWIGIRRAGSGDAFAPLPGSAYSDGELRARWDSDSYPPGRYEFEARGYDLAGNATSSTRRSDGTSMTLPNPLKTPTAIDVGFAGAKPGRRTRRTSPYGRRVLLRGRLLGGDGSGLAGRRPVQVTEGFAGGGAARSSVVWTDASGAFAFRLPRGPSREVRVGFAGSPTLTRSAGRPLELKVRAVVRLRASASGARIGGAPVVFRGRVEAARGTIPRTGRPVELQFRLPGLAWSEFRTVHTDRHGRFRYAYRFSDDDSRGARFQFRACAPADDGWPYAPGRSLPVLVTGV